MEDIDSSTKYSFLRTSFAGPVYELRDYIDWTENKNTWSGENSPPYMLPFLQALGRSLLCMGLYLVLYPHFSNAPSLSSGIHQHWSAWKTFGFLWMCGFTTRWKFYFIWSISEASLILSGMYTLYCTLDISEPHCYDMHYLSQRHGHFSSTHLMLSAHSIELQNF